MFLDHTVQKLTAETWMQLCHFGRTRQFEIWLKTPTSLCAFPKFPFPFVFHWRKLYRCDMSTLWQTIPLVLQSNFNLKFIWQRNNKKIKIYHALCMNTLDRRVCDGKYFSSKRVFFDLLHKLASLCHEALNPSIVPIGHTQLPFIRQERQAVRNPERETPLSVRGAYAISNKLLLIKSKS